MDAYLRCLYNYILETRINGSFQKTSEYRASHKRLIQAWNGLRTLEDELLFQVAVSLGKWMVRS